MIHAFALEPQLVATWGKREEFRFVHDKFGPGTPRVMLEIPVFGKWKDAVCAAAADLELTDKDWTRLTELFRILGEGRCRRSGSLYVDVLTWLENAEREHDRKEFRATLATKNPRQRAEVVIGEDIGVPKARLWSCEVGAAPPRTPEGVAAALSAMLVNCRALHLVDPYFHPEKASNRKMLEAILDVVATHGLQPGVIRVHCRMKDGPDFFQVEAEKMAARLPDGISVEFRRWRQRDGGEQLHNRYVLTELGGVALGTGLDEGDQGETDDVHLLTRTQYDLRWSQYVGVPGAFDLVNAPKTVTGSSRTHSVSGRR